MKSFEKFSIQLLFVELLFPFIGLYNVIKYRRCEIARIVIPLFFIFIGISKIIALDALILNDSERDVLDFLYWSKVDNISLWNYFNNLQNAQQIDYYLPFMKWLISRFTDDYKIFLGGLMLVYGLFFARNISYMMTISNSRKLSILLLFTLFLIPNPNFYTHRWWLALQVFLSGLIPYMFEGKNKNIVVAACAVLVHYAFIYPLFVILVYKFLPMRRIYPFVMVFVISNFLETMNFEKVLLLSSNYLPTLVAERNEMYVNAEFVESNLFSQLPLYIWKYMNLFISLILYFKYRDAIEKNIVLKRVFVICLLLGSLAMVMNCVEWGWRFFDLSNYLFCCLYIYILSLNEMLKIQSLFKFFIPFIMYVCLFQIRGILVLLGVKAFLFGNVITSWFFEDKVSILDQIKNLM